VFKKECQPLGSKSVVAFQAIYRVTEMTGKDSKQVMQIPYYSFHFFFTVTEFLE
jgi:hypothetical protein